MVDTMGSYAGSNYIPPETLRWYKVRTLWERVKIRFGKYKFAEEKILGFDCSKGDNNGN